MFVDRRSSESFPILTFPMEKRSTSANRLKLNSDKSELLIINSKYRPRPLVNSISFGGSVVQASPSACNLSVVFDNESSLDKHISSICKSGFFHLRRIAKIRSYLTEEATIALVHAFITAGLIMGMLFCSVYRNIKSSGYSPF